MRLGHSNGGDRAFDLRLDWHLHFHGLKNHNGLSWFNGIANLDLDLPDGSGNMRVDAFGHGVPSVEMTPSVVKLQTWARVGIVGFGALCSDPQVARAHPELTANKINRYLTVAVTDRQLEVSVALLFGELPAVVERKRLDANRDATISDEELRAGEDYWASRGDDLAIFEGKTDRVDPWKAVIDLDDDRSTGTRPLVVDLRREYAVAHDQTRVALGPRNDLVSMGETEIGLVLGPGWKLEQSTSPDGKVGLDRVFKLPVGANRTQVALATFILGPDAARANDAQKQTSHPWLWLVGGAIGAAGLALAALGWRRSRRN